MSLLIERAAFIILLPREADAGVKAVLDGEGRVAWPERRGLAFLSATGGTAAELDRWWAVHIPSDATPVYLVIDEVGLEDWLPGTHGLWIVGVDTPGRGQVLLHSHANVFPIVDSGAEVARYALRVLGAPGRQPGAQGAAGDATGIAESPAVPVVHEAAVGGYAAMAPAPPVLPISYDVRPAVVPPRPRGSRPLVEDKESAWRVATRAMVSVADRVTQGRLPRPVRRDPGAGLGILVNTNRPIVVGFASRKGGVGKTTYAAAVAATVGESLDGLPDTAALVDGNVNNPDSWALHPPAGAATVRRLVSCLTSGLEPPPEQYAMTPRLAIYPESRTSEEAYAQAEVDVIAEYLRRRHAFVAVDLPNSLPALTTGGPGSVAAAWLCHCDVVVLPFNADPRARLGLLEYVDALADDATLASLPIVAPYITSGNRLVSRDPAVQADLSAAHRHGVRVVVVPDDDNALVALLRDLPINRASGRLRRAYIELTTAIVEAAVSRRMV